MSVKNQSIFDIHPFKFISKWRSLPAYEMASYFFIYASVPMLAFGVKTYNFSIIKIILLTVISLYAGFFAVLIWNDITDVDIDIIVHPDRPIPDGRITTRKMFIIALFFSIATFIFSIFISIWCFILVGCTAFFVTIHNKYLKTKIKFPAYSEILTPIQWIVVPLFGFLAIWTALPQSLDFIFNVNFIGLISTSKEAIQQLIILIIFTYFADNAHDVSEGIHDLKGDKKLGVKTYAASFGEKNAARISFIMFLTSGFFGVILYLKTILSPLFLILFTAVWLYTLIFYYRLLKAEKKQIKEIGAIVGRKGFDYLLFSYNLIFLDMLIQLINHNF